MSESTDRHDILLVSQARTTNFGEGISASLMRFLAASRMIIPTDEAVAKDWVEVYFGPGESAHELFATGTWQREDKPLLQAVMRWGRQAAQVQGYGPSTDGLRFYLELRGALFEQPHGSVLKRMSDLMHGRFEALVQPHRGLVLPREVPEDERPPPRKRVEIGPGLAGTRVEEL